MRLTKTLTAIALLTMAALCAQAQKAFVPESMVPREGAEYGLPTFGAAPSVFGVPESQEEVWATDIVSGLSLRRSVKLDRKDLLGFRSEDTPFFYLFTRQETTDLTAGLGERTRFTYTRQLSEETDILDRARSSSEYSGYGIEHGFGGGATALTLGFRRGVREVNSGPGSAVRTSEQAYSLAGGLGDLGSLSMAFTSSTPDQEGGQATQAVQGSLTRSFSGGEGKFAFSRDLAEQGQASQASYKAEVAMPLAVRGGTAQFSYVRDAKVQNGNETSSRQTALSTPLALWSTDASLSWQLKGNVKAGNEVEQRTTTAVLPLRLFDRRFGNTFTDERVTSNGAITRRHSWVGEVPFEKSQITLGYIETQPYSASGDRGNRTRIEMLQVPSLRVLTDRVHAGFAQTRTETLGGSTVRVTKVNAEVVPTEHLKITGQMQEQDAGPGTNTQTTTLQSDLAVSSNLSLNCRYLERQQVGISPQIERYVGVEHKREGPLPLAMRVGYTSYGTPDDQEQREGAYGAQLSLGAPDRTSVSATYMQFQDKDLARLSEDVVQLALTHRFHEALAVRAEYEDQPGRAAPMRGVLLQAPVLGCNLTLAHRSNPQDPRNSKVVREAEQWDAEIKRPLAGLDLLLGYRYCDYERDDDQVEQYLKLALAGGKPEGGGQLTLGYATGDFAPPSPKSGDPLPGSTLELQYQKRWSAAQLTLSLRRMTAPWGQLNPENHSEGRLEVKALW